MHVPQLELSVVPSVLSILRFSTLPLSNGFQTCWLANYACTRSYESSTWDLILNWTIQTLYDHSWSICLSISQSQCRRNTQLSFSLSLSLSAVLRGRGDREITFSRIARAIAAKRSKGGKADPDSRAGQVPHEGPRRRKKRDRVSTPTLISSEAPG